jgi:radical SAM superfamily enzyme YgiQ (UPF0313 family)
MEAAPRTFEAWYETVRGRLSGQGLWLRGGEINALSPGDFAARDYRVLFTRMSTYFDTGYSFTHQILYQMAAGLEGVYPDLAYLPPRADQPLFAQSAVPWLLGTQTKRAAKDFDLIGFSNSIVQELINLPTLLKQSAIPLKKSERMDDPGCPILILGGANALYSSVLWTADPMVDGIFVGESDAAIRRLLEISRDGKRAGKTKREILKDLLEIPGFFEPEAPRSTRKSFIWSLNQSEALEKGPVYYLEDQLGRSHLQISEGCPCFCSFCAESWDRKPYRERNRESLKKVALKMKASMGLDSVDLYSFNFNMHSDFYPVLWDLVPIFKHVGLKSQRFDLLAHDPEMIEFQHAIEKASLTCGLEGISPRLRKYLHKNLENDQLHRSLQVIFRSKARELKVFLIATGLEEEQDFVALEDMLGHFRKIRDQAGVTTRLIFSMTPLVRFPWTPLEFEDGHSIPKYQKILNQTAKVVRRAGFEFRESAELPEYWVSQVLVRASDPRIAQALVDAVDATGFVYHREVTPAFRNRFEECLRARSLDPESLLEGFTLEESEKKPWALIDTGVKRDFLWKEVERARSYVEIDYCLGRNWKEAQCFLCGGCPSAEHILDIVKAKQTRDYSLSQFKARLLEARNRERSVRAWVTVGPKGRGAPRKMVAVALARALMLSFPDLTPYYRGYVRSCWSDDEKPCWVVGDDSLELRFDEAALPLLEQVLNGSDLRALVDKAMGGWAELRGPASEHWVPKEVQLSGELRFSPERYFKSYGIKYTLRKPEAGLQLFDLTPPSLKKGVLRDLKYFPDGKRLSLTPGPKFHYGEFVERAFQWKEPGEAWRVTGLSLH